MTMRPRMPTTLALLLVALAPAGARAERYFRGLVLYQQDCTSCHSLGWKTPGPPEHARLDLTRVIDRRNDASLRKWLEDPTREKRDTGCIHHALSSEQIDDLIRFFHIRAVDPPLPTKAKTRAKANRKGGAR